METYDVLVRVNENREIVAINSSAFISDLNGWVTVDSGIGDRFYHAQNNYLDKPIINELGIYLFTLSEKNEIIAKSDLQVAKECELITQCEQINNQICVLKRKLSDTDYAIIKIAEKAANQEEYADIILQRQAWRTEINELEAELQQ